MKIYNEVTTIFNDLTGKWETISEDSYEYNGPVTLAQGIPPNSTAINAADTVKDTIKTTAGYFTNGDGTLEGDNVFTGALDSTNEKYYFNVNYLAETDIDSETQFSVTFGHFAGSGSDTYGDSTNNPNTLNGETQVIYNQLSHVLQHENEATGGFKISEGGSNSAVASGLKDDYVWAIIGKRARYKDRLNKKAWTLHLSGSDQKGNGTTLSLTDDSKDYPAVATPAGPRYNIVSGTLGNVEVAYTSKTYGWFYPERGIMVFSGAELSASIPGPQHFGDRYFLANGIGTGTSGISGSNGHKYLSGSADTTGLGTDFTGSINAIWPGLFTDGGDSAAEADYGILVQVHSGSVTQTCDVRGISSLHQIITCSAALTFAHTAAPSNITASIGIPTSHQTVTSSFSTVDGTRHTSSGFAPNLYGRGDCRNALRFVNCMKNVNGMTFRIRSEEDATEEHYFCRIGSNDYNFSSNPTFVSGSKNKMANEDMWGNPQTFITGVRLFNSAGQLLAVAELSKPLKKNFASEATIKVQLSY